MGKRGLNRNLYLCIMLLVCIAILGGCKTNGKKTYKKKDVTKYLNTRFHKKDYTLSKQSKDSWTVKLKGMEEITFELSKDEVTYSGWSVVTYHYLESDIDYLLTSHYLEQYRNEYPDEYHQLSLRMETYPDRYYSNIINAVEDTNIYIQAACPKLYFTISSRTDLLAVLDGLAGLVEYLEQQPYVSGFYFDILHEDNLPGFVYPYRKSYASSRFSSITAYPWHRNIGLDGTYGESIFNEIIFDREKLLNEWDYYLIYPYAMWRMGTIDYSDEEIAALLEKHSEQFILTVQRPDGSIVRWPDMLRSYSTISIGVLHEVLQREGIPLLEGTKPDESDMPDYDACFSWVDETGDEHLIRSYHDYRFEYLMNGENIVSGDRPEISLEYFQSMTGLSIYQK